MTPRIIKKELGNHCWHWCIESRYIDKPLEECCNCGKIVEEQQRWLDNNGQCEWEYEE